jgi:hypothetical protein
VYQFYKLDITINKYIFYKFLMRAINSCADFVCLCGA